MTVRRLNLGAWLVISLVLLGSTLGGSAPAHAAEVLTIAPSDGILWVEAPVARGAENVEIKIFGARNAHGPRSLIQRCSYTYSGPGTYRCGIEADGPGMEGSLRAKLFVDNRIVAAARYSW